VVTAFVGGINIRSGGRTRPSTLSAGAFLLFFILVLSKWLVLIPMGALVAVMFMVAIGTFDWSSLRSIRNPRWVRQRSAAALAAVHGAQLHVVHAVEFTDLPYSAMSASPHYRQQAEAARRALDEQIARALDPGTSVATASATSRSPSLTCWSSAPTGTAPSAGRSWAA
jgi:hypothetical protein